LKLGRGMTVVEYFEIWYPLPNILPHELKHVVYSYIFNPVENPWFYS